MRAVIGTVISSEPITLDGAAATISNFAAAATGSRPEIAVFSTRASRAFAELLAFHRNLRSPYPAAVGDLHSTRNRADAAQIGAGIGIGDESPSLGTNRASGHENGAGSGVEREIDVKRKKTKERGEAAVENVSDERDGKWKNRKERAEGNWTREEELAVQREEPEGRHAGVGDNVALRIDNERDGKRKKRKERSRDAELAMNATNRPEGGAAHEKISEGVIDNGVLPRIVNSAVGNDVVPSIDNERGEKKKRSRDAELAMNAANRTEDGAVHEKKSEGVINNGVLPGIVNAAVDNGVVLGIDSERGGKKKRKKRSRDAELAVGHEDPGMNAVRRLEGVDDERDGKRKMLKERAVPEEESMGVVQPMVKVEKEEFGEERSEERKKKKRREKSKNREDDLKVKNSVVQVEVKLEKEEFGEEGRSEERRNLEGEVNVDGVGKKRRHLDDENEEGGLEGRREPHNISAELGGQSEQHHKKKRRKRE